MNPAEVDRLVKFNEPETGDPHRILFECTTGDYFVVLLNDLHPELRRKFVQQCSELSGQTFHDEDSLYALKLDPPIDLGSVSEEEKLPPLSAWTIATNGSRLIVPKRDQRGCKIGDSTYVTLGIVVTGKSSVKNPLQSVRTLAKSEPTPFVTDEFGDSYNDSFFKEPRIIDTVPETVLSVVDELMAVAKTQFQAQNYAIAAKKYQKAFHYIHSFYPEHLEPEDLDKLTTFKMRALLNLALASNKCKDYKKAIEAANFVLDMPEARSHPSNLAKALYQLGMATRDLGDEVQALEYFRRSNETHPDVATQKSIIECQKLAQKRRAKEKSMFKGAFDQ